MRDSQRFNFTEGFDTFGVSDALTQMPLTLTYRNSLAEVSGLLDTGASVNVLPYSMGIQLGAVWEEQTTIDSSWEFGFDRGTRSVDSCTNW